MEKKFSKVDSNDDIIADRARAGDRECQDYLLNKYKNLVKKIARPYNIAGGDTQDIIQEGMIGLYKAIRDFDISKGIYFHIFAKTCINRQIITAVRTASRKKHNPLNNYISLDVKDGDDEKEKIYHEDIYDDNPETIILSKERSEIFNKHLKEVLTEKEQRVLALYLKNHSYAEIAEKVGITYKGITSTIHRIKRKLLTRGDNIL